MSIPLVQNNEKDSINTSIIAIKRNIERINMLLGLVDSGSPDLSGLATKQELEDAITQVETDLAPVDEVTSGNMQSVTSNAVYKAFSDWQRVLNIDTVSFVDGVDTPLGKIIHISLQGSWTGNLSNGTLLFTLPGGWRPVNQRTTRFRVGIDTTSVRMDGGCDIYTDGTVKVFLSSNTPVTGSVSNVTGIYADAFIIIN